MSCCSLTTKFVLTQRIPGVHRISPLHHFIINAPRGLVLVLSRVVWGTSVRSATTRVTCTRNRNCYSTLLTPLLSFISSSTCLQTSASLLTMWNWKKVAFLPSPPPVTYFQPLEESLYFSAHVTESLSIDPPDEMRSCFTKWSQFSFPSSTGSTAAPRLAHPHVQERLKKRIK